MQIKYLRTIRVICVICLLNLNPVARVHFSSDTRDDRRRCSLLHINHDHLTDDLSRHQRTISFDFF